VYAGVRRRFQEKGRRLFPGERVDERIFFASAAVPCVSGVVWSIAVLKWHGSFFPRAEDIRSTIGDGGSCALGSQRDNADGERVKSSNTSVCRARDAICIS
jgi:hypothetical protein